MVTGFFNKLKSFFVSQYIRNCEICGSLFPVSELGPVEHSGIDKMACEDCWRMYGPGVGPPIGIFAEKIFTDKGEL